MLLVCSDYTMLNLKKFRIYASNEETHLVGEEEYILSVVGNYTSSETSGVSFQIVQTMSL